MNPPEIGVHTWCLEAAWQCRKGGLSVADAVDAIRSTEVQLRPGRRFGSREVEDAVARAYETQPIRPTRPRAKPVEQFKKRVSINAVDLEDLQRRSPWGRPDLITAETAVDLLFPSDDLLLCMAKDVRQATTAQRDDWQGREHLHPFIVPNVANALVGQTADGRPSRRCNAMFPERVYAVCEFDDGAPYAEQAGRAIYLGRILPLVLVCHSGNKSLHAWFLAAGETEEDVLAFYDVAISLGADHVGRTRCQMMRTPGAWRIRPGGFEENESTIWFSDTGVRQRIHYFDQASAWTGRN